ncbi:Tfp pilus assembly protein tip-associated adhesin PilY1-like protein [Thermanaerovibrio acidaminovorans DSM 6589]|uniref:Tfp pilus assembly protein tip-associated adhesin PilY1-like protein n=1 Tax=Thermanaerovibrio acidaminovorans (strain ATCC 49978 / DSM 6589 / Su883) TaxID=525903 RepID=D1B5I9_THEAS|nr:Tfp pilus assembly protein tip-associated adhesin PilY1-like protein [Thermanaerovibrio acidaminovorans DSM 6589]
MRRERLAKLALPIVLTLGLAFVGARLVTGSDQVELNPFFKEAPKGIGEGVSPNVFILIDTSAPMLWSTGGDVNQVPPPNGQQSGPPGTSPYYQLPNPVPHNSVVGDPYYYYESSETYCTYGDGSQPYGMTTDQYYQYWGRDIDPSNNREFDEDCYAQDNDYLRYRRGQRANGLVPNDSRAFKMKLVLWRLIRSPEVIRDSIVGVATYYQQDYSNQGASRFPYADWYRGISKNRVFKYREESWPNGRFGYDNPQSNGLGGTGMTYYGRSVRISRGVYIGTNETSKRAMFIVPPAQLYRKIGAGYQPTRFRDQVTQWFNGTESQNDRELRFDGKRPLAQAIAFSDKYAGLEGSLRDFFCARENGKADVNNVYTSVKPNYVSSWCQGNYAIILTAGGQNRDNVDPVEAVRQLQRTRISYSGWGIDPSTGAYRMSQPVRVFVVGFINPNPTTDKGREAKRTIDRMADVGDDGLENGSASAFYANDVGALMEAFKRIFETINSNVGSGGAPTVSPKSDGSANVYSATFAVMLSSKVQQWKGDIVCYGIDKDDNQVFKWSAAEKLNAREHTDRTLYALVHGKGLEKVFHGGSFSDTGSLASQMGVSSSQAELFLRWLMGDRTVEADQTGFKVKWDEDFDEAYPHKRPSQRYKMGDVYHGGIVELAVQSSTGSKELALLAQDNLGLLHAFDGESGVEKWAFAPPNVLEGRRLVGLKQFAGSWIQTTDQNQIYASVPRYMLDGPLMVERTHDGRYVLLGLLGRGGCGLYAMDVTSPWSPRFLWGVENQLFGFSGGTTMPSISQNRKIVRWDQTGRTVIPYDQYSQWGQGGWGWNYSQMYLTTSTPVVGTFQGKDVFLMGGGYPGASNLHLPGAVFMTDLLTGELQKLFTEEGMGPVVGSPKALRVKPGSREIDLFYFGDLKSAVWRASAAANSLRRIVPVGVIPGGRGIAHQLGIARVSGALWVAGITGHDDGLEDPGGSHATAFAFPLARAEAGGIQNTGDLSRISYSDQSVAGGGNGWYMPLEVSGVNVERPTTPPVIKNGYAIFATFVPSSGQCLAGSGRLYAVNVKTGASGWGGQKFREIENLKITGITIHKNKIHLGVQKFSEIGDNAIKKAFGSDAKAHWDGGMITLSLPPNVPRDENKVTKYERLYWRRR